MKGFTFIEMIIVLAIAAVICLLAIPSFLHSETKIKGTLAQAQLLTQLHQAQEIANNKMVNVTICLSSDGQTCVTDNAAMILLSIGRELVMSTYIKGRGRLHLRSYPAYRNYILMSPTVAGSSDNGTFWYCSKENVLQWAVTVSQSGEPQLLTAKNGVIDNIPGKALECRVD